MYCYLCAMAETPGEPQQKTTEAPATTFATPESSDKQFKKASFNDPTIPVLFFPMQWLALSQLTAVWRNFICLSQNWKEELKKSKKELLTYVLDILMLYFLFYSFSVNRYSIYSYAMWSWDLLHWVVLSYQDCLWMWQHSI